MSRAWEIRHRGGHCNEDCRRHDSIGAEEQTHCVTGHCISGSRHQIQGDFEKRIKAIIKAASNDPNLVMFIDEFHTIVGAGGGQGSLDAANMLKPALARGELQCDRRHHDDEFTRIVEKDGALGTGDSRKSSWSRPA